MIARRTRQVLSPVQQHQSPEEQDSPLFLNTAQFRCAGFAASSSSLSFKHCNEASPSSLYLSSLSSHPYQSQRVSCFVEVPAGTMGTASNSGHGAGTKRKRVGAGASTTMSTDLRGRRTATAPTAERSRRGRVGKGTGTGNGDASSSVSTGLRRRGFPPSTPQKAPLSNASNNSDWSSLASNSPSNLRTQTLLEHDRLDARDVHDQLVESWINGGGRGGNGSNQLSLRQSMRGMTLEDGPASSTGMASGSGGGGGGREGSIGRRRIGGHRHGPHDARSTTGHRNIDDPAAVSSRSHNCNDRGVDDEDEDDEAEDERLLTTAPNWQLSRLRKVDLIRLNRLAGAWDDKDDDREIDPDLYTKQELVNSIIVGRSRLDKGKGKGKHTAAAAAEDLDLDGGRAEKSHGHGPVSASLSSLRATRGSAAAGGASASATGQRSPTRPLRDRAARSRSRSRTRGSVHHDAVQGGKRGESTRRGCARRADATSDSEGSNEGGGEETEAEPARAAANRRRTTMARRPHVGGGGGTLRRMDSSMFEEAELMRHSSATDADQDVDHDGDGSSWRRRQRPDCAAPRLGPHRQSRAGQAASILSASRSSRRGRDRSIFGGSDADGGANDSSTTSLAFTSSGVSPLGPHLLRRRGSRRNLFVASSPVRATGSRIPLGGGGNGGMTARRRPMTRATAAALQGTFAGGGGGESSSSRTSRAMCPSGRRTTKHRGVAVAFREGAELFGGDDAPAARATATATAAATATTAASRLGHRRTRDPNTMEEDWEEEEEEEGEEENDPATRSNGSRDHRAAVRATEAKGPERRLTRAKARQNSLHEQSADDADCELVSSQLSVADEESNEEGSMNVARRRGGQRKGGLNGLEDIGDEEETPGKSARKPLRALRRGSQSGQQQQRRGIKASSHVGVSGHGEDETDTTTDQAGEAIGDDAEDDSPSDISSSEEAETPVKFRKLRNGKLRMPPSKRDAIAIDDDNGDDGDDKDGPRQQLKEGGEEGGVDVEMEAADVDADVEAVARGDVGSDDGGRGIAVATAAGGTRLSPAIEEAMFEPTASSLSRLRRAQLVDLCEARALPTDEADRKADLIDRLLQWYSVHVSPPATARLGQDHRVNSSNDDEPDAEAEQSDAAGSDCSSASTARQGSDFNANGDGDATTPRTAEKKKRVPGGGGHRRTYAEREPTSSEVPLLLRGQADKVGSASKLPTPPLTSRNDEGHAAEPGDGVDELNGLDLESLDLLDKEIPASKLEKLEKIGSGGFKDVYVGRYRISKARVNRVAIADIRDQLTEMDIKELSLLRDLRHENIVRFIGVSIPDDPKTSVPCMIVSELCVNGDLFDYIRNVAAPNDYEVFRILLETARGLEYLHTRTPAIIHRDCKSTNVLITRNRTAKINDFGLAKVKNTQRSMMRSLVGTVNWQAVELWVAKPHYNEKVDVWSAAMTFWETLQWHQPEKRYPFQGMNEHQIYQDVGGPKKVRPYTGKIRRQFGAEIVELLERMWHHTPRERPSMTQVCEELEALVAIKKAEV